MTSLSTRQDKYTLYKLFQQIQSLRNLENSIFIIFGESDNSPLDSPINELYDVFIDLLEGEDTIPDLVIDKITDIVFSDEIVKVAEKFEKIMKIVESGGDEA